MASSDRYEIVIGGDDGLEKEHAEFVAKELTHEQFHDDAVQVREVHNAEQ